jgi:hypothetical protein
MAAAMKRIEEAYPWKASASSGHITNLKQSILETFNIYGYMCGKQDLAISFLTVLNDISHSLLVITILIL